MWWPKGNGATGVIRTYIFADIATVGVAAVGLGLFRLLYLANPWFDVVLLMVMFMAICLLVAYVVANRRPALAVTVFAVTNWAVLVTATTILPDAHAILATGVILPTLLAVQVLDRRRLSLLMGAAFVAAIAIAIVARWQPGPGFQEQIPIIMNGYIVAFVPLTVALVGLAAWQSHVALVVRAEALQDSRARLVATADRERRQIERDLHDGAQQRLVAAALQARVVQRVITEQPDRAKIVLADLIRDLQHASTELRDLAHGIYPPELTEHGLAAALRFAARQAPRPVTVHAARLGRYRTEVEINVYYCCPEAIQNAVKHAGDHAVITVDIREDQGLTFDVSDTGRGCPAQTLISGHGYTNMRDRLGAIGGDLTVTARLGQGVHIHGHVPALMMT